MRIAVSRVVLNVHLEPMYSAEEFEVAANYPARCRLLLGGIVAADREVSVLDPDFSDVLLIQFPAAPTADAFALPA